MKKHIQIIDTIYLIKNDLTPQEFLKLLNKTTKLLSNNNLSYKNNIKLFNIVYSIKNKIPKDIFKQLNYEIYEIMKENVLSNKKRKIF